MHKAECEEGAGLLQERLNPATVGLGARLGLGTNFQGTWAGLAGLQDGSQKGLSIPNGSHRAPSGRENGQLYHVFIITSIPSKWSHIYCYRSGAHLVGDHSMLSSVGAQLPCRDLNTENYKTLLRAITDMNKWTDI